ncbi:carboxypeptidase-like regulatory domain-containing protein [Hymenobacter sp. UV11]|uniref:carboxypeptidase-like regulatory domain-containing protein n=1 Tax=Hymenobacter sp. UV11 TaxID=1849735 RepID=UPI001415053C|nr:carboxypeptidase-like regulatory domain-containing protein [Hymenobacter sp. UV11]
MNRLFLISCWIIGGLLAAGQRAEAQTAGPPALLRISGTVSDAASQRPLPGATVRVQRTRRGTAADAQGHFLLTARPTDTLLVRALGYKPQQVLLRATAQALQVRLLPDSVRLGEVKVMADRADRASIDRALRNLRRPPVVQPKVAVRPKLTPLFPVDSTSPPPPPFGGTPIDWAYKKFSREGKERRKMQAIKVADAKEKAHQRQLKYNKAFKDNRGYE